MKATYVDHMGSDLSVVNAARVSFNKKHEEFEENTDTKLIRYLARENHKSPFNHTFLTFHVKAPIFVARQLVKHEYMPWNEVSRRYVTDEPEFYFPNGWRRAAPNVKQGSSDETLSDDFLWLGGLVEDTLSAYKGLLADGVAPEMARMILPQSMYTEWYWSGTLFAFAKMYNLRVDAHSQRETQEIARQIGEQIAPLFPVSWEALTSK